MRKQRREMRCERSEVKGSAPHGLWLVERFLLASYILHTATYILYTAYCLFYLLPVVYAAGTTSAEFLKIGVGPRPSAMGGAFTALSDDKSALYYNPAGLSQIEYNEVGVTYNKWVLDTSLSSVLYGHSFGDSGGVAAGLTYLDSGDIEERGDTKDLIGSYKNTALAFQVGYGNELFEGASLGIAAKIISETIKDKTSSGFAADFGLHYKTIFNFGETAFGAAVQNIGSNLWDEFAMPSLFRAGVSVKPVKDVLTVTGDYVHPLSGIPTFGVGLELKVSEMFVARSGYRLNASDVSGLSALTLGFGLLYSQDLDYGFNYSFSTQGDLGIVHRVEVSLGF